MTREQLNKISDEFEFSSLNDQLTAIHLVIEINNKSIDEALGIVRKMQKEIGPLTSLQFIIEDLESLKINSHG